MLQLYSGTPGSGKSYHATSECIKQLKCGRNIIANFKLDLSGIKGITGAFFYYPDDQITVPLLCEFARCFHVKGREAQTYLIIDEAGAFFNPKDNDPSRRAWQKFFCVHRHLGFNVTLIAQRDRLIDRQIRTSIEYDVVHYSSAMRGDIGFILSLMHISMFFAKTYWYNNSREFLGSKMIRYNKKVAKLYDSYALFDSGELDALQADAARAGVGGFPRRPRSALQPRASSEKNKLLSRLIELITLDYADKSLDELVQDWSKPESTQCEAASSRSENLTCVTRLDLSTSKKRKTVFSWIWRELTKKRSFFAKL